MGIKLLNDSREEKERATMMCFLEFGYESASPPHIGLPNIATMGFVAAIMPI